MKVWGGIVSACLYLSDSCKVGGQNTVCCARRRSWTWRQRLQCSTSCIQELRSPRSTMVPGAPHSLSEPCLERVNTVWTSWVSHRGSDSAHVQHLWCSRRHYKPPFMLLDEFLELYTLYFHRDTGIPTPAVFQVQLSLCGDKKIYQSWFVICKKNSFNICQMGQELAPGLMKVGIFSTQWTCLLYSDV